MVPTFTPKELEVAKLLLDGHSPRSIADTLSVTNSAVNKHIENIYRKLGVNNKIIALSTLVNLGVISFDASQNSETASTKKIVLTKIQSQILHLVSEGYTNSEIALKMRCNRATVYSHLRVLFMKFGIRSKSKIARIYKTMTQEI